MVQSSTLDVLTFLHVALDQIYVCFVRPTTMELPITGDFETSKRSAIIHRVWFAYPAISEFLDLKSLWQLSRTCRDFRSLKKFVKCVKTPLQTGHFDHTKPLLISFDPLCDLMQGSFVRPMSCKNVVYSFGAGMKVLEQLQLEFPHVELYLKLVHFMSTTMPRINIPINKIHFDSIKFNGSFLSTRFFSNLMELVFSNCIFFENYHAAFDSESLQHLSFTKCHFNFERFKIQQFISPTLKSITFRDCSFLHNAKLFANNFYMNVNCKIVIENCPNLHVPTIIVKKRKNSE